MRHFRRVLEHFDVTFGTKANELISTATRDRRAGEGSYQCREFRQERLSSTTECTAAPSDRLRSIGGNIVFTTLARTSRVRHRSYLIFQCPAGSFPSMTRRHLWYFRKSTATIKSWRTRSWNAWQRLESSYQCALYGHTRRGEISRSKTRDSSHELY